MEKLLEINIYKVILFGSYAEEREDNESDIDLLIVLDDDTLPENYDQWLEIKMKARRLLREINREIAIEALSKCYFSEPQYWVDFSNSLCNNELEKSKGRATFKIG